MSSPGALLALSLGAGLVLGHGVLTRPRTAIPRRAPARWVVADRDGGEIVQLDEELFVVGRQGVPWPTHLRGRRGGGAWVVCALEGHPRGQHELRELDALGGLLSAQALPPVLDLETDATGAPVLLVHDPAGGVGYLRLGRGRVGARLRAPPQAQALVPSGARLGLVAGSQGFLLLDPSEAFWMDVSAVCGRTVLGACATGDGWWLLCRSDLVGSERLLRVDLGLRPTTEVPSPRASRLARGGPGRGGTWVLGEAGAWALAVGPGGAFPAGRAPLPALGAQAALATNDRGLLVAAPGALLRLDRRGSLVPGQGGFTHLVDLAALERVPPRTGRGGP